MNDFLMLMAASFLGYLAGAGLTLELVRRTIKHEWPFND